MPPSSEPFCGAALVWRRICAKLSHSIRCGTQSCARSARRRHSRKQWSGRKCLYLRNFHRQNVEPTNGTRAANSKVAIGKERKATMNLIRIQRPEVWVSPFDRLTNLRDEINRLFDAPYGELGRETEFFTGWSPALDVYEDKDNLFVKAE